MIAISFQGVWAHKRRLVGTFLAVFLGVAFLAGTLMLNDTLSANFDSLFASVYAHTDAVIRTATRVGTNPASARGLIAQSLVARVRAGPGVANAAPAVQGYGRLIDRHGKAIGGGGPPTLAGTWVTDPDLTPYRLVAGRPPRADDEVVINRGAAKAGDFHVGDTVTVATQTPVRVKVVGIATFGSADGFGGSTFTAFTLAGAQRNVTARPGQITSIAVKAAAGVSQEDLVRRLRPLLPHGVEAVTRAQLAKESADDINAEFLNLFQTALVVFAGIALLVAAFSIANTFAILVAQRTRESALLRVLGASRGQILTSVLLEALLVGVAASAAGLVGGLGIASLLKGVFAGFGFALPASGLAFTGTSSAVALLVGVVVTLLAGVFPAVRASRVPPLAVLRDVSIDRSSTSTPRAIAGIVLMALGVLVVATAVNGSGSTVLMRAGLGAVLTLIGMVVLGPTAARPASAFLGWPLPRLRGITGALARQNALRNPGRTAGTAAALMVGVGVVTLFTVLTASLKASIQDRVATAFGGDLVISAGGFAGGGFSPHLATAISRLPVVRSAIGVGSGTALIDGAGQQISVVSPTQLGQVRGVTVVAGSLALLANQQVAVSRQTATTNGWHVGTPVRVTFPDGAAATVRVGAIYTAPDAVGAYVLTPAAWAPHAMQELDSAVFITLNDGVALQSGKAAVQKVATAYGAPQVLDRQGYNDAVAGGVNQLLSLVYVLLALAIIIALMGIANTLSLAIHERTRELGLLRAVGQSRAQVRAMVRWEAALVAMFGTVGGLGLGVFLGWALVRAAAEQGINTFAAAPTQLIVVLVVGGVAGVVASLRPARRAARLNVLEAIATE